MFSVMPVACAIHGLLALWIGSQGRNAEGALIILHRSQKAQTEDIYLRRIAHNIDHC
jgi:hypothetical protein